MTRQAEWFNRSRAQRIAPTRRIRPTRWFGGAASSICIVAAGVLTAGALPS